MAEEILCIIAGRAGSKRLPGKNTMLLAGKPLIQHTIGHALATGIFKDIAVTSDSDEILAASKGANILIKRPAELATDTASSLDVIMHAIDVSEKQTGENYNTIVLLQPTSPMRLPKDINKALQIFAERPACSLVSVAKVDKQVAHGRIKLKDGYELNGSIYIWDKRQFLAEPEIIYADTRLMEMPRLRSLDIDYQRDFDLAELLLEDDEYKHGESIAVD